MMYYIQTQDGDLPNMFKIYKTKNGAHKAAFTFMTENYERGEIVVADALHSTHFTFFRNVGGRSFTEEVLDPNTCEAVEMIYH